MYLVCLCCCVQPVDPGLDNGGEEKVEMRLWAVSHIAVCQQWEEKVKMERFGEQDDRFPQNDLVGGEGKNIHVGNTTYLLLIILSLF